MKRPDKDPRVSKIYSALRDKCAVRSRPERFLDRCREAIRELECIDQVLSGIKPGQDIILEYKGELFSIWFKEKGGPEHLPDDVDGLEGQYREER
jgi:hypothetical protein